jgi:hypothetical protein
MKKLNADGCSNLSAAYIIDIIVLDQSSAIVGP